MDEGQQESQEIIRKENLTKNLMLVVIIASLASVQYGYYVWIVYSPSVLLQDFYNSTSSEQLSDPDSKMFLMAITIALFPLGAIFGSLPVGYLADRLGRKGALVTNNILGIISAVLMACSNEIDPYEYTMFARLFTGIYAGILSSLIPFYLAEIAPGGHRGCVVMVSQLFINLGILIAQILSIREIFGNRNGWTTLLSLPLIFPILQLFLMPCVPESPRYLMIQKRQEDQARTVLKRLREQSNVKDEIEELRQEDLSEKLEKNMNPPKLLTMKHLRWQVLAVFIMMLVQQFTGLTAVFYYAERTYSSTTVNVNLVRFITIATTGFSTISILTGMYFVDRAGRRPLLLIGLGICTISSMLLVMSLEMQSTLPMMAYFSSVLINLFLCAHALAPNPVAPLIVAEMFLQSSRSSAFVIGGFSHWVLGFGAAMTQFHLEKYLGSYNLLMYWPVSLVCFIFILRIIPETKNRTFLEIRRIMLMEAARRARAKAKLSR